MKCGSHALFGAAHGCDHAQTQLGEWDHSRDQRSHLRHTSRNGFTARGH